VDGFPIFIPFSSIKSSSLVEFISIGVDDFVINNKSSKNNLERSLMQGHSREYENKEISDGQRNVTTNYPLLYSSLRFIFEQGKEPSAETLSNIYTPPHHSRPLSASLIEESCIKERILLFWSKEQQKK